MENVPLNRIKPMLAGRMMLNKELAEKSGKAQISIKMVISTSQPGYRNFVDIARWLFCKMNDMQCYRLY